MVGTPSSDRSLVAYASKVGVLAAVYFGAARLGLSLQAAHGNATPVWAPAGIALAALLLVGLRMWPGIALGAFFGTLSTGAPVAAALGVGVGNTVEGLLAAYVLTRFLDFRASLERVRDVLSLAVAGALGSTLIGATIGLTSLWLAGVMSSRDYWSVWGLWWFGDAMSILLVTPLLLAWSRRKPDISLAWLRVAEGLVLLAALALVSGLSFFGGRPDYPFIIFPIVVWAAVRFRQRGVTMASFVVAALGIIATLNRSLPVRGQSLTDGVVNLQALIGVMALTGLILAATITERLAADEQLRRSEERTRAIFQNLAIGIAVADRNGRLIETNPAYRQMLNLEAHQIHGRTFAEFTHPDDLARNKALFDELIADKRQHYQLEKRYFRAGGELIWVNTTVSLTRDSEGRPQYAVGLFENITERKKLEVFRNQFVANAAHELRTPLTAVTGFATLLADRRFDLSPAKVEACIDGLKDGARRLRGLVENVLDLTQVQEGRLKVTLQSVELSEVAIEAIKAAAPPEEKVVHALVEPGITVLADAARLEQIVTNLLTNAYRYGGPTITIQAEDADAHVDLIVADDGRGAPPELIPYLFEPFRRGGNANGAPGSGLGLAIVRMIVEAFGGRIWYEPGDPTGARFVLRLVKVGTEVPV